jgi:hypothetical protein
MSSPALLLALVLAVAASPSSDTDFRAAKWGMTKAEVKASEKATFTEEENALGFVGSVAGLDAVVIYNFSAGRLVMGTYSFTTEHVNANLFIDDYHKIKGLLAEKYGEPTLDRVNWSDDLYKDDPEGWGTAVSIGHLVLAEQYDTDKTIVRHMLRGDNFKIKHFVQYQARSADEDLSKRAKEDALKDL